MPRGSLRTTCLGSLFMMLLPPSSKQCSPTLKKLEGFREGQLSLVCQKKTLLWALEWEFFVQKPGQGEFAWFGSYFWWSGPFLMQLCLFHNMEDPKCFLDSAFDWRVLEILCPCLVCDHQISIEFWYFPKLTRRTRIFHSPSCRTSFSSRPTTLSSSSMTCSGLKL